jgi:hypothetical protein
LDVLYYAFFNAFSGGDKKDLHFMNAFKTGFLNEYQYKILYLYLDHFPDGYIEDGWLGEM